MVSEEKPSLILISFLVEKLVVPLSFKEREDRLSLWDSKPPLSCWRDPSSVR